MRTKTILSTLASTAVLLAAFLSTTARGNTHRYFPGWGTPSTTFVRGLKESHIPFREFSPSGEPRYENKIMNYILAIDGTLETRMIIVRTRTAPLRDYLMVKGKLYSILEHYGTVSSSKLEELVKTLTATYGPPQLQKTATVKTYSFSGRGTKALLLVHRKSADVECRIYYYSNSIFKMLIAD